MAEEMVLERQLLEKLLAERADLDQHIALLQKRLGAGYSENSGGSTSASGGLSSPQELLNRAGVLKGEFYGMSRPQAAIALLKKLPKTPLTTNQIFEALKDSGLELGGKNALNGLYTSLSRLPEIRKVAPNTWGLKEWYPHLKEPKKRIPVMSNEPSALTIEEIEREDK